jgi:V/A-type H+/Na+-transporting ATPase subunit E
MTVKDGVLAITNEVLGDVQKEAEAVMLEAENEAKEVLKGAKKQAEHNYRTIISQATLRAEDESRKISSVTEVEIRNILLQTKEDLVDAAFKEAVVKLKNFVTTKEYHSYILKLIEDVSKKIGQKILTIEVNAKDKDWLTQDVLNSLSKKIHFELTLSEKTIDLIGGCIMQTEDGKIICDVSIDNRLQEIKSFLRIEVAKILFVEAL